MKQYIVKVALRGVSPMVWRRFELNGNTTIADLHHVIQIAMGWDNVHLHRFRINAVDYGIAYEGGLTFTDWAFDVTLDRFEFDAGDRFIYEYNLVESKMCDIRIEKVDTGEDLAAAPKCIAGKGVYHEYLVPPELDVLVDMAKLVQNLMTKVTQSHIQKSVELLEEYKQLKFDKKRVNRTILEYHLDTIYRLRK